MEGVGPMSIEVTVTLPDEVYRNAVRLDRLTQREVGNVLTDALALSLPALPDEADTAPPIATLSDDEVLRLTTLELPPEQDDQLSVLLDRQQAGLLTEDERGLLARLMRVYQESLLRKAEDLREAIRRGLREPLAS